MVKHYYREANPNPFICDILHAECVLTTPDKDDCISCVIYQTWKENKLKQKG